MLSSALFLNRWLAVLVGHLPTDLGNLGATRSMLRRVAKIATRRAPRWQARQMRQHHATKTVNQLVIPLPNDWSRMRILLVE